MTNIDNIKLKENSHNISKISGKLEDLEHLSVDFLKATTKAIGEEHIHQRAS